MTLVISHLLPAVSALHPYPLCTGLCSSLSYLSLTHLEWWHSYSLFWVYFKARGGISKEGICLLLLLLIPYSSFFSLQDDWCVFNKNEYFCLGTGQICPREMIQVCDWGAGNDGRHLVRISQCCYFWPASEKLSDKTLALVLKSLSFESNQTMGIDL